MKLYERGATIGQTIAFLVASPWNSFSLTIILIALIGFGWTAVFTLLSMVIAVIAGMLFHSFERAGTLPGNPNQIDLPHDFRFWREARAGLKTVKFDGAFFRDVMKDGVSGSKMVLRWIFFGVVLAGMVRAFVSTEDFQTYFGASLAGLGATMLVATIIEICSEGSSPIAADRRTSATDADASRSGCHHAAIRGRAVLGHQRSGITQVFSSSRGRICHSRIARRSHDHGCRNSKTLQSAIRSPAIE